MSRWSLGLALVAILSCTAAAAATAIALSDAWVREAPPGAPNAAYFTLHNDDDAAHTLTGAESPQFARAELHVTRVEGGRVRMQQVQAVEVPAHGSVAFSPGNYHLMLMQPRAPLKAGDRIALTLQFKDAPAVSVQVPVASGGEEHDGAGHGAHHPLDGM